MIELNLGKALREFIEEAVKDFRLPVENGEPRAPQIINGFMPHKQSVSIDDFPYVLVRPEKSVSEREATDVTVSIIIGCYSDQYDGYEYCFNVYSRIRNALASMENNILANKYVLRFPIECNLPPEQPWPEWQLDVTTYWQFNTPIAIFEED